MPESIRVEPVTPENAAQLKRYANEHGREHDDSYLPGVDFELSPDCPGYLLRNGDAVVGAAVLMRTERFRKARKGRFSILHAFPCTRKTYSLLLKAMHPHFCGLGSVFLFLPERKRKVRAILEGLGFSVERYSSLMENRDPADPEVRFPRGFTVRPLDVSDWDGIRRFARCVNVNFRETAGHIDSSPDDIRRMFHEPGYLKEGICMLWKEREAVGTVCISREPETAGTAEIGGLSVDPRFREQGLGRMLLRYARRMAHASGFPAVVLSVNAENELAFRLYRSEGFLPLQTMVCYTLMCGKRAE